MPQLTYEQRNLRSVKVAGQLGCAAGLTLGCLIGMFPLLFFSEDSKTRSAGGRKKGREDKDDGEEEDDDDDDDVVFNEDARDLST